MINISLYEHASRLLIEDSINPANFSHVMMANSGNASIVMNRVSKEQREDIISGYGCTVTGAIETYIKQLVYNHGVGV